MGGSKGQVAAEKPKAIHTKTSVGSKLDPVATTFDDTTKDRRKSIDTKTKGARGLRIPLESPKSSTKGKTADGVQL